MAVTGAGHEYVFWEGPGGDIDEAWYRGSWRGPLDLTRTHGWGELGQTTTRPAIAVNPVNESEYLFWTAVDGRLYEAWYSGGWRGSLNTGWSTGAAPALAVTPTSRQYVFWQGPDGGIWESSYVHGWSGTDRATAADRDPARGGGHADHRGSIRAARAATERELRRPATCRATADHG